MSVTFGAVNAGKTRTIKMSDGQEFEVPTTVLEADYDGKFFLNLSNDNARAFLSMLGNAVKMAFDPCIGDMEIAIARRAIMVIRATFTNIVGSYTRDTSVIHGSPRVNADGTVELLPVRCYEQGIDSDYFERRLSTFASLVEAAAERGATHITWG